MNPCKGFQYPKPHLTPSSCSRARRDRVARPRTRPPRPRCVCVCVSCACVYVANQGAQGRPRSGHWGSCDVHLNSERMSCIDACPCQIDIEIIKETDTDIVCKWCTAHFCRCSLDAHGQGGLCASGVTKHSVASLCANLGCYVPTPIIFLF